MGLSVSNVLQDSNNNFLKKYSNHISHHLDSFRHFSGSFLSFLFVVVVVVVVCLFCFPRAKNSKPYHFCFVLFLVFFSFCGSFFKNNYYVTHLKQDVHTITHCYTHTRGSSLDSTVI